MSSYGKSSANVNKTIVLETIESGTDGILTGCTSIITNLVQSCTGNTSITMGTDLISTTNPVQVNSLSATTIFSGGTNLIDLLDGRDTYLSGSTLSGSTLILTRNDGFNVIQDLSSVNSGDTFVTGATYLPSNDTITLSRNDDVDINITGVTDTFVTGGTLTGSAILVLDRNDSLSAITVDLNPLLDDTNSFVTGSTFNNDTLTLTLNNGDTVETVINEFNNITVSGDTSIGGTLTASTIDTNTILSGGTNILDIVNANDTFVTGGTLSDKTLVLDRNDSLSAITVDLSGLTTDADNGLTLTSGGTIELGGTLKNNRTYFLNEDASFKVVRWGDADGAGNFNNIGRIDEITSSGRMYLEATSPSQSARFQYKSRTFSNVLYAKQAGNVDMDFNPSSTFSGVTYTQTDGPGNYIRTIYLTDDDGTGSTTYNQGTTQHQLSVTDANNYSGSLTVSAGLTQIASQDASGSGIFSFSPSLMLLANKDFAGVIANNNYVQLQSDFNNYLWLNDLTTNDNILRDATSNKRGLRYVNFGESDVSGTSANYDTLVGTSLVPKIWVEDYVNTAVGTVSGDTYTTGFTYDNNNNFTVSLNDGTNLSTNISQVSGLTVNGDVLVNGNVDIIGSATTINSEQVLIKDNIITLNSNVTGATTPILDAGFEVLRGSGDTKQLLWNEITDEWTIDDNTTISGTLTSDRVYTDILDFNTGYTGNTIVEGRMYWSEEDQTVAVGLHSGEVQLQLGQETHYLIKNQSGTTIENGRVVRAAGTLGSSGRLLGEYMIADGSIPPKFTLGVATHDIVNGEDGYVTEFGLVRGVNTTGSLYGETWSDGDLLWVSPTIPGGLTNVEPVAPNLHIEVAIVVNASANGSIFVRPHRYPYAHDIQDMGWSGGTESNLDVIQWDSALGYFNLTNTPNFNSLSATTISGGTFYGDGSNLTGITDTNFANTDLTLTGARTHTLNNNTLKFVNGTGNLPIIELNASNPASHYGSVLNIGKSGNLDGLQLWATGPSAPGNVGNKLAIAGGLDQGELIIMNRGNGVKDQEVWFSIGAGSSTDWASTNSTAKFDVDNFYVNNGKGFIVGSGDSPAPISGETISLQGLTLVADYLVQSGQTSAIPDASLAKDSFSFHIDGGTLAGRYKNNLGVVTDLTIGAYEEYDFALRSSGVTTYYTDFYTCYNNAISGDVIDVQTDHTTDCGLGTGQWSWNKDITINLNGHNLIVTGLGYIGVQANVKIKMTNGTFEVQSNTINQSAFNFVGATGTSYFEGDGVVNVFCYTGGSARGGFRQASTGEVKISGVIMKGNYTYCVRGGSGKMYVDNCIMYTDEATNADAVHSDNVTVTNSTIYGQALTFSGNYTFSGAGGRSKVRMFKNCSIIPLGTETPIGSRCAIFENCNIEATDNEARQGIGGEQEYYNCKIERKGTVGFAFDITNTSNARLYNTEIISTGGGVRTNLPVELYHCYIKTESGYGIDLTTSVFDNNVIIDNCHIDTTGGDCIYTNSINDGLNATITNSTLISRTDNEFCLNAPTGTYFKFTKNIFKNTVDANDVYSRVGLVTENTQVQTTDSFGNIILD